MPETAQLTISAFTDALAAQTSTPGGGGAAAVTGSIAAALVSMVIQFTVGKKKYAEIDAEFRAYLAQSETLRAELLALADADVEAFNGVAAAYSMPRDTDEDKAARTAVMQAGLQEATRIPYIIAEKCLAVLQLAEPVGAKGNPNVVSDAATAVNLAEAGLLSALVNVDINLKAIKDAAFLAEWEVKRDELKARGASAAASARAACVETLGV